MTVSVFTTVESPKTYIRKHLSGRQKGKTALGWPRRRWEHKKGNNNISLNKNKMWWREDVHLVQGAQERGAVALSSAHVTGYVGSWNFLTERTTGPLNVSWRALQHGVNLLILSKILFSFYHTHLSLPPDVCYIPDQAAHYHLLCLSSCGLRLWSGTWLILRVRELVYSQKVLFLPSFLPSSALADAFQGHAIS
jgi:hypothetical protein